MKKRTQKTKQTLEQYLNGWKEAVKDIYTDEVMMSQFLEIKKSQFKKKLD